MVSGKNMEDTKTNGKQRTSRGPSPNGHLSDGESSTDDSEHDNGMRIGEEYQAVVPEMNPSGKVDPRTEAMLVWAPHPDLPESKVSEYCTVAKEKHGYNIEQALGMLFWHKHNIDKALTDLANFTPFPDEWTVEDKVLFEQAFSFHGKSFHRIRQMLPDKTIASLVKYYYSWKKTRSRTSLMDRQARKYQRGDDSDDELDGSGNSDSDFETSKENGVPDGGQKLLNSKPGPKSAQSLRHSVKNKRKPPRGMYLDLHDLNAIATGPPGQGAALLKNLDAEIVSLKRTVQNNKQLLSMHKHKTASGIDLLRPLEPTTRINARWTNEELLLAVQGVRKYGKDFKAIAEVIGNKSEGHIRSFFVNYKRRYNLDEVLAEYYAEYGHQYKDDEDEKMEVDVKTEENGKENPVNTSSPAPAVLPSAGSANSAPPPLLKQASPAQQPGSPLKRPASPLKQPASPHKQQPPPLQQQQPRLATNSRPVLQQPPPLVRPNTVSITGVKSRPQTPPVQPQINSK